MERIVITYGEKRQLWYSLIFNCGKIGRMSKEGLGEIAFGKRLYAMFSLSSF
jgi:hypothetical protein